MDDKNAKSEPRRPRRLIFLVPGMLAVAVAGFGVWRYIDSRQEPARRDVLAPQVGLPGGEPVRIDAGDPELVVLGRKVYRDYCAACHGTDREGEPDWKKRKANGTMPAPPHDETGHTWHHPDGMLFTMTKMGGQVVAPAGYKSGMPGFMDVLSDREIVASLAFIKSYWPAKIRKRQERISAQQR